MKASIATAGAFAIGLVASLLLAAIGLATVVALFVGLGLLADLILDIPSIPAEVNEMRECEEPTTAAPGIDIGYWGAGC